MPLPELDGTNRPLVTPAASCTASLAWLNGRFVPFAEAVLPVYDLGLVGGITVTEQTRTFAGVPFRLEDHLRRLCRALTILGWHDAVDPDLISQVSRELVNHNRAAAPAGGELGLIQFVTGGALAWYAGGPVRAGRTVCLHTFPLALDRWSAAQTSGLRLVTVSVRQLPAACMDLRIKSRSRWHYFQAEQQAHARQPGALPLLLNLDGSVSESSTANILLVRGRTVVSPPVRRALPGVSRAMTLEMARGGGYDLVQADVWPADLHHADEIWLTSTPYCLLPVTRFDDQPVGEGLPGDGFRRVQAAWSEAVGVDIGAQLAGNEQR